MSVRRYQWVYVLGLVIPSMGLHADYPVPCTATKEGDQVLISWETVPERTYSLWTTTNLTSEWGLVPTAPSPLVASAESLSYAVPVGSGQRFFQVVGLGDTAPALVLITAGTFTMGSPETELQRQANEGPQTVVTLSQFYYLGQYEVTQGEYLSLMGTNPSSFTGDLSRPVETVSWNDAMEYCSRLTAQERAAGRINGDLEYRLPTEAEWEYACRAGTSTPFGFGESLSSSQANFDGNYPYGDGSTGPYRLETVRVGSFAPNAWGLYDMHGNVWEWCLDRYTDSLPGGSVTDPTGPDAVEFETRLQRGGGWFGRGFTCRSAYRRSHYPIYRDNFFGFRVALVQVAGD